MEDPFVIHGCQLAPAKENWVAAQKQSKPVAVCETAAWVNAWQSWKHSSTVSTVLVLEMPGWVVQPS
jgi:hypothetical protein